MNGKAIANLKSSVDEMVVLGFDLHQIERIANLLHTEVSYGVAVLAPRVEFNMGRLFADGHYLSGLTS
jgi:hypothetical protein